MFTLRPHGAANAGDAIVDTGFSAGRRASAGERDVLLRIAERMDGPLAVVDVGAQSLHGEDHVYEPLRRLGLPVRVVGFEPLAARAAVRRAEEQDHACEIHACEIMEAFIGDGETHVFHENNSSGTSSLLALNPATCGGFASLAGLRTVARSPVRTTTLDTLFAAGEPVDFLKLDIQGFELAALRGAVSLLPRVAMIQSEVEFAPIYAGQPLFSELELFLREHGFDFLDFHNPARRAPVVPSGRLRHEQLLWADALFTSRLAGAEDRVLLAQAILAIALYGRISVAERALAVYDRRHGAALAASVSGLG